MNRIILCLALIVTFESPLLAQDPALVERVNRLSVYVEELMADKVRYQKQITDLTREVADLREELQRAKGGASQEDVAAVIQTVQQLERKHRQDMDLVARQIEDLGKKTSSAARARSSSTSAPRAERGFEYTIEPGNTLSAIAQAYRDQKGLKITADDILQANPGLDPKRLQVGQVIFIPEK